MYNLETGRLREFSHEAASIIKRKWLLICIHLDTPFLDYVAQSTNKAFQTKLS